PGFGEQRGIALLHALKEPQRMEIAGSGPDRQVEAGHRLEIVVEDIGLGIDPALRRKSGVSTSIVVAGDRSRIALITAAKCAAPPSSRSSRSTEVTTAWESSIRAT